MTTIGANAVEQAISDTAIWKTLIALAYVPDEDLPGCTVARRASHRQSVRRLRHARARGVGVRVPVVASNRGSLPEIVGDAAVLVDPSTSCRSPRLERAMDDDALRARDHSGGGVRLADGGAVTRRALEAAYHSAPGRSPRSRLLFSAN